MMTFAGPWKDPGVLSETHLGAFLGCLHSKLAELLDGSPPIVLASLVFQDLHWSTCFTLTASHIKSLSMLPCRDSLLSHSTWLQMLSGTMEKNQWPPSNLACLVASTTAKFFQFKMELGPLKPLEPGSSPVPAHVCWPWENTLLGSCFQLL